MWLLGTPEKVFCGSNVPDKKTTGAPPSNAEIGRDYCNKLFEIEKELAPLSPDKRKAERLRRREKFLGILNLFDSSETQITIMIDLSFIIYTTIIYYNIRLFFILDGGIRCPIINYL